VLSLTKLSIKRRPGKVAKGVPERGGARRRRASVGGGAPRPGASAASEWTSARERAVYLVTPPHLLAARPPGDALRLGIGAAPGCSFLLGVYGTGRVGFFGGAPRMAR
jgi:hypothetical protein